MKNQQKEGLTKVNGDYLGKELKMRSIFGLSDAISGVKWAI
jgi:hypothetical protein